MSEKYTPTTEDVRACHRTYWFYGRVHGLTREEAIEQANTEFERWLAKVKADAVREAAEVIESEAAEQWQRALRRASGGDAEIVAHRMDIMGRVLRDRADKLEADDE